MDGDTEYLNEQDWFYWAPILIPFYTTLLLLSVGRFFIVFTTENGKQRRQYNTQFFWHLFMIIASFFRVLNICYCFTNLFNKRPLGFNLITNRSALCFFNAALNVTAHQWLHVISMLRLGHKTQNTKSFIKKYFQSEKIFQFAIASTTLIAFLANAGVCINFFLLNKHDQQTYQNQPIFLAVIILTSICDVIMVVPFFMYSLNLIFIIKKRMLINRLLQTALRKVTIQMSVYTLSMILRISAFLYKPITNHTIPTWLLICLTFTFPELFPSFMQLYFYGQSWNLANRTAAKPANETAPEGMMMFKETQEVVIDTVQKTEKNVAPPKNQTLFGFLKKNSKKIKDSNEVINKNAKNTSRELPSLMNILYNKEENKFAYDSLMWFLQKEFAEENLEFWSDVQIFLDALKEGKVSLDLAKILINQYIVEGSPREVNLPSEQRISVTNIMKGEEINFDDLRDAIIAAQSHVFILLKKDCYPRFVAYHEKMYEAMMEM